MSLALPFAIAMCAPLAQSAAGLALRGRPREIASLLAAAIGAFAALAAIEAYSSGARGLLVAATPLSDLTLAFRAEPLGLTLLALVSSLNVLSALFAGGYRRARGERGSARGAAFAGLTLACAYGAMNAANLFAFFVSYVGLALAAFPLVGEAEPKAARGQLAWMLGPAVMFFLPAAVWTSTLSAGGAFAVGGILPSDIEPWVLNTLILLFAAGLAGAAAIPAHRWQIEAAGAPAPTAILLQSLAIAPTGAIGFLKIASGIFGAEALAGSWAGKVVLALALASLIGAPLLGLARPALASRLAYSTLAANAFTVAASSLGAPAAILGAILQIIAHAIAKTTMLLAAATIETATGRRDASEMGGLGQRMPWTFAALAIGAFSLAGLAPAAGAWALLWTVAGAGTTHPAAVVALAISAVGSFAMLAPAAMRGFSEPAGVNPFARPDARPLACITATAIGALACLSLVAFIDPIARFVIKGLTP
jgi:multicomponent Na+:H+ antiporter subunit D